MSSAVVYPQGATSNPILIPAPPAQGQTTTGEQAFAFPAAAAGTTMYVNFVVFDAPPANAPGMSPPPTLWSVAVLHDILGTSYKTVGLGLGFITIDTGDGNAVDVELQQHPSGLDGVYQLIFSPENNYTLGGTTWKIQWTNADPSNAIQTTFVVDTADTVLPWIAFPITSATDFAQASTLTPLTDAPHPPWTTPVQLVCGQTYDLTVPIYNYGPAPLSINITAPITAGQFAVQPKTKTIAPGGADTLTVQLSVQSAPAALNSAGSPAVMMVPSADAVHPGRLSFYATVGNMEFVFALDVSGSMATTGPDGSTRWFQLQGAFALVMSQLQKFANGGTWAALLYPSTQSGYTQIVQAPTAITASSSITLAYTPTNGTPMGPAIYIAMGNQTGSPTSDCGQFVPDDGNPQHNAAFNYDHRWLILMTDGAANIGDDPATFSSGYYSARNVKAVTVGFGVGGQTNPATLSTIATNSGGKYFAPDPTTGDPSNGLAANLFKAVSTGLALSQAADPSAILPAIQGATNRHSIIVTAFDRKVSFVLTFLTAAEAEFAAVTLVTPAGKIITPETAASAGLKYDAGPLSKSYFADFVDNRVARTLAGAGTWTIVVTFAPVDSVAATRVNASLFRGLRYAYQAVVDSALTLHLSSGGNLHYAGDPITLSAALAVSGLPVRNASVSAQMLGSGQGFDNWLASQLVTDAEYKAEIAALGEMHDYQSQYVKALALAKKGITFSGTGSGALQTLTQNPKTGAYETTYAATTLPGTYQFLVTATGHDDAGNLFQRQKAEEIVVHVMPDEASTQIDLTFQVVSNQMQATLRFWLRDSYGNIYLVDPTITNIVQVLLQGGAVASGPLKGNLDGSYTQIFTYPLIASPIVSISVGGTHVVPSLIPPNFSKLMFVDQVIAYKKGREAQPGANTHTNPDLALGDPSRRPLTQFVSVGGLGWASFAINGKIIKAQSVTIFVAPDTSLRAYAVDVLAEAAGVGWIEVGRSAGVTQTFSLLRRPKCACAEPKGSYVEVEGKVFGDTFRVTVPLEGQLHPPPDPVARLQQQGIRQIRIRDLSNLVRNPDRSTSSSPGVSLFGIGFTP